jgi:hypothetical protein
MGLKSGVVWSVSHFGSSKRLYFEEKLVFSQVCECENCMAFGMNIEDALM